MKNLMFNFTRFHTRLVVIKSAYFFTNTPYNKGCKDIGITKSYTELCK